MSFEFPPCLAPFVSDTGGHISFVDTVGVVAKSMALDLKPFGTVHFVGLKSGISSTFEITLRYANNRALRHRG